MRFPLATFFPANPANYTKGRQGNTVDRITVHHTAGMESTLKGLYENPKRQGSAHFFVHPQKIEQYVDTADTAWTNGNFSSNLRAITIEVRGDWRGYYDQATLDNLRILFAALRREHPNARLTYHMDESQKGTLCPADLKHKGYALREWNAANIMANPPTKGTGGSEVADRNQVNNIYRGVLMRAGDEGGLSNYTGRNANQIVAEMLASQERVALESRIKAHEAFYNTYANQIGELSSRPTKQQLEQLGEQLKREAEKVQAKEEELARVKANPEVREVIREVEKEVVVEKNPSWLEAVIVFVRKVLRIN